MKRCSALVTAICLSSAACKKEEPAAPEAKVEGPATPTTAGPTPTSPTPTIPGTPVVAPVPAVATAPSYTAELDPLLDLVPAGAKQFLVTRDPNEVLDEVTRTIAAMRPSLLRAFELDDDADADVARVVKDFESVRGKIATSGIDFDRGMVIVDGETESDVFVFAATDPEALNKLQVALGFKPDPMKCQALADVAGYVACAEKDDGALAKYVPAKAAAARRAELGKELAGVDLEHANMLGRFENDKTGGFWTIAISTVPSLVQVHVATKLADDFETFATPGPAPALALAPVGSSFVWGRFATAFVTEKAKSGPAMFGAVAATLTGEYFVGSLAAPNAIVAIAGVTDAGPTASLVPMFGLVQDQVPKTLPDGTALAMKVDSVDAGTGTNVQALHASGTGKHADLFTKAGLAPEGVAFAAGKYAAIVLGAGTSAVAPLAKFDAAAAETPVVSTLPAELATSLQGGTASLAVHLELDGLQNPALRDIIEQLLAELPASKPGTPAPKELLDVALGMFAPFSSASLWITGDGPSVVHVALRSYDEASPERAFARVARTEGSVAAIAPALGGVALLGAFAYFAAVGRKKEEAVAAPPR